MEPSQVSTRLRQIASAIEKSNQPNRDLVVKDIKHVLFKLAAIPDFVDPEMQNMMDEFIARIGDVEYVEAFFDNTPEPEWTAANLEEYLDAYEAFA